LRVGREEVAGLRIHVIVAVKGKAKRIK
jgi:hypothetical protein